MRLNQTKLLWLFFIIGIILRIAYLSNLDPSVPYRTGGDSGLYLQIGRDLLGTVDYTNIPIPVAPVYLLFVGLPQHIFTPEIAIYFIWLVQILANMATCYFVYRIASILANDERVGFLACSALIFSVAFAVEFASVLTESLYIFFVLMGLWLYIEGFLAADATALRRNLLIAHVGISLGLAILTRPVLLLFPFGIVLHMLMIRQWRYIPTFLVLCGFVTLSWTAYTALYYNWTVIGSNQFMPAVWRGAVEGDGTPQQNDALLAGQTPTEQATEIISSDPLAYIQRRIGELIDAYLQPYGTIHFGHQSLKAMTVEWLNSGLSPQAFWTLINGEGFWAKLLIYIWHFTSLIGGLMGMWFTRKNWQVSLVLIGFIAYTTLLHTISLALPRYISPTYPIWWIFAAVTLIKLWDTFRIWQEKRATQSPPSDSIVSGLA